MDIESQMTQSTFEVIFKLALSEADPAFMNTVQRALGGFTSEIA